MRREIILKITSVLIGLSVFTVFLTPVLAAPVQPFNRWGFAFDNGGLPLNTQNIYAWIDGMSYGMTVTGTGPDEGLYDIDCEGDGDDTGTEKEGGYNGDTVYYTHGDLTTSGTFFGETDVWIVGGFNVIPADLNEVVNTPPLLKINNVASQANVPSGIDAFVIIYNPSSGPVDLFDFSLDIGGAGPVPIAGVCPDSVNPVAAGGWAAIDLTGQLSTTGNSITLSETATGYIVDRVEYGAIPTEPENTIMGDAPNPLLGMEIYRQPVLGSDTNDCSVDFILGPVVDHAGLFPVITATGPDSGGLWTNVAAVTITYSVANPPPAAARLFYSVDGGANWNFIANDADLDGSYGWSCPADGIYDWYGSTGVPGVDPDPVPGSLPEWGSYMYDGTAPTGVNAGPDLGDILTTPTQQGGASAGDSSISGQASLVWTQTGGPGTVTFAPNPNVIDPTVSADADGLYTCRLTITDNAGNSAWDEFTFTWTIGGAATYWDIYNGQNFRTFTSTQTFADSEFLAVDIIDYINTTYGESLEPEDVQIFRYNSVTGLMERCFYWIAISDWWGQFALIEGDTYIVTIAPGALTIQPRSYELPNTAILAPVPINIYNGQNFRGVPVTTFADAEFLAVDIIDYINTTYGESLEPEDVEIFRYNSVTGLMERCFYWIAISSWWGQFPLNPGPPAEGEGYIVTIAPGALSVQPRAYTPP